MYGHMHGSVRLKFDVLLAVREKQRGVIIVLSVKCIKPAHFTAWHVSIYAHN